MSGSILAELREIISRDKRRFEFSDTDSDNLLSREELMLFLHPEESKRMTAYLVKVIIMCYADMAGMGSRPFSIMLAFFSFFLDKGLLAFSVIFHDSDPDFSTQKDK